ncbi:MAG: DNA ligase, partial [Thermoproteota archaeon]
MTNFSNLAVVCRKISKLTSKKRMIKEFSDFISKLNPEDVRRSILIISGRVFPPGEDRSLGVSWGLIWKALKEISGLSDSELYNIVSGSVDIGEAARRVVASSKRRLTTLITPKPLTIGEVHEIFKKLSLLEGKGSQRNKRLLLVELFSRASPDEAEIIAKSLVGEVRIGFHEGLMVEAVSKAFEIPVELVREKTMATGDLSYVAYIAATAGLKGVSNITVGLYRPLKPMLASDVHSIQEALRKAKGEKLAFEYKFDGARVQIHVGEEGVRIYSRRLKDVTESLPDVVKQVKEGLSRDVECILDGEAVAIGSDGRP